MEALEVNAKEYLSRYITAGGEIEALIEERQRLRSLAEKTTVSFENDGSAAGSRNTDKLPEAVEKIMEIEEEIGKRVSALAIMRLDIYNTICKVPDGKSRVLLLKRYIGGESFERIAADMGYTYNHICKNLHSQGLDEVDKILKESI
jgi:hypothetical protein